MMDHNWGHVIRFKALLVPELFQQFGAWNGYSVTAPFVEVEYHKISPRLLSPALVQ